MLGLVIVRIYPSFTLLDYLGGVFGVRNILVVITYMRIVFSN